MAGEIAGLTTDETTELVDLLANDFGITLTITKEEVHTDGDTPPPPTGDPTQPPKGPGH